MSQVRYAIHVRTNGTHRIIYAHTEQARENAERALERDPDSVLIRTVPERVGLEPERKRSVIVDIIVGVAILVALFYGAGVL